MKSKYLMIGAAVCAALFLFSGIMLCRQYADGKQATEAFEQVAALVETEPLPSPEKKMPKQEPTISPIRQTTMMTVTETHPPAAIAAAKAFALAITALTAVVVALTAVFLVELANACLLRLFALMVLCTGFFGKSAFLS